MRIHSGAITIQNPATAAEFRDHPFDKRPGSSGSGLGLAIVQQLAAALGVGLEKRVTSDMAAITLRFPVPERD